MGQRKSTHGQLCNLSITSDVAAWRSSSVLHHSFLYSSVHSSAAAAAAGGDGDESDLKTVTSCPVVCRQQSGRAARRRP